MEGAPAPGSGPGIDLWNELPTEVQVRGEGAPPAYSARHRPARPPNESMAQPATHPGGLASRAPPRPAPGPQRIVLGKLPFRDLARARCACRSANALGRDLARRPFWTSALLDARRGGVAHRFSSLADDIERFVDELLERARAPAPPDVVLVTCTEPFAALELPPKELEHGHVARVTNVELLVAGLAARLPPWTTVVTCAAPGLIATDTPADLGSDAVAPPCAAASPSPRLLELDPARASTGDEALVVAASFISLGEEVRAAPFVVRPGQSAPGSGCPFHADYELVGDLPGGSPGDGEALPDGTPTQALVFSRGQAALFKANALLPSGLGAYGVGNALRPVGGICASLPVRRGNLLLRPGSWRAGARALGGGGGARDAPAPGGGVPEPEWQRRTREVAAVARGVPDSPDGCAVGVLLFGPGLEAEPLTVKGHVPVGPALVVSQASTVALESHGGRVVYAGLVGKAEVEGVEGGPPRGAFEALRAAMEPALERGLEPRAVLGLERREAGGAVRYEMHDVDRRQLSGDGEDEPSREVLVTYHDDHEGVVRAGDRLRVMVSTPDSNAGELEAGLRRARVGGAGAAGPMAEGVVGFVCAGRGQGLYGEAGREGRVFEEACPGMPVAALYVGGELGPPAPNEHGAGTADGGAGSKPMGFTSVYAHLRFRGQGPA